MSRALTFVEIDIDVCQLSYGEAPCAAEIGVTGERKCFNSISTCQDRDNLDLAPVTLRFAVPAGYVSESGIDAIPSIDDLSITPAVISLGEDMGQRASVRVTFNDHPWSDTGPGFDPYVTERGYDPFRQGTFWPKFRARQPFLRGRKLRVIQGLLGQELSEMETRHYVIDSFDGPTVEGQFTIIAKDPLKLADGDRAQAPKISNGFLSADIANNTGTITINPAGIGDAEYPASGKVAIGGKEIVAFTRSGDTLTITRGQSGTEPQAHSAGDRVQLCLEYAGEDAADVIRDLFVTYAGIDDAWINIDAWRDETINFLRRQYSAVIPEPTSVRKLVSELVEQAAIAIWWDDLAQRIRLQVLRQIPTDAQTFDERDYIEATLQAKDQPSKRVSQVWTYFGQINPLQSVDDENNYRSVATTVDVQAQTDEGSPAVKRIFSRWTPPGGRLLALRVNDIQLGRYVTAPRRINFDLFRYASEDRRPLIGQGYRLESWHFQDDTGARLQVPAQVTRLAAEADRYRVECEELRFLSFDQDDLDNRVIIYDSNLPNANLRETYNLLFPPPDPEDEITCIIETGAIIWSQSRGDPAFTIGDWPEGTTINVILRGRIQGRAGNGGRGARDLSGAGSGQPGGPALFTRFPINLFLNEGAGEVWGGGGGGGGGGYGESVNVFGATSNRTGGGGGGGGAGFLPGSGGAGGNARDSAGRPGRPGTTESGGSGGTVQGPRGGPGGRGGNPGQSGQSGSNGQNTSGGSGGSAGRAIDGNSFVTRIGTGDVRGPTQN